MFDFELKIVILVSIFYYFVLFLNKVHFRKVALKMSENSKRVHFFIVQNHGGYANCSPFMGLFCVEKTNKQTKKSSIIF